MLPDQGPGHRLKLTIAALAACCCTALSGMVRAQDNFPSRPIRLLIPFAPGGTTDVFARKYAERMSREMAAVMARPDIRERVDKLGFDLASTTPAELAAFMPEQLQAWSKAYPRVSILACRRAST